ncbi:GGDEF domain-containing response regulator [Marinobacterium jannaschii]|uniref:GGDEF domain-containing response regulator n=1 Tax=Marinobacterium jannaschii TaxID=64970 RepID=UPI0004843BE5|nr:GGDEF domain-containing response regulator [Marinobacterium jannaschii]
MNTPMVNSKSSNIFLMAEDNPADAELVTEMLFEVFGDSYSVVCVDRFEKVVEALAKGTFQSLILDMGLPDRSGVENIREVNKLYPNLPIVVLTGQEDLDVAADALQKGAQDYLTKNNVSPELLARSLHYAKERKQIELKLKQALEDSAYRNVQLEAMVKHDPLTRLPNRTYFHDAATRVLHRAKRSGDQVALLYFDLNGFKKINDTYGHLTGDELLKQLARRLEGVVRDSDFLARLGGDEFVIISDLLENRQQIYPLIKRILSVFDSSFEIDSHQILMTPSVGVAFYPHAETIDLLIKHADCAMYEAKRMPDYPVCFYTQKMAAQFARNQAIELELSAGLANTEFSAWFQPVIAVQQPETMQVEALVRWQSPRLGWVPPDHFISLAEMTPAINGITRVVVNKSRDLFHLLSGDSSSIQKIAINVTASQLSGRGFYELFLSWLEECGLPPECICLELTEREIVQSTKSCRKQLERFRAIGMKVALDDFGCGFSSITHLLDLPLDILKLDRMLIDHIDVHPRNQALTAGIVEMAHRLDMEVVAEGIERREEYEMAIQLGCDHLQGFYIARPMPIDQLLRFYSNTECEPGSRH